MVVIIIGLGVLISALRANHYNQDLSRGSTGVRAGFGHGDGGGFDATKISLRGVFLAQLAVGVLGVLVITGEYGTGMIRSSLASVPRRIPVLVAKAFVIGVVAFAVAAGSSALAFLFGQRALASTHLQATLATPHAFRAVLGAAVYLVLIGLLAVGLGFLVRNTAGAIATLFGIVLVLPLLTEALPTPYSTDVGKYLPLNAGTQIIGTSYDPTMLSPWTGLGVVAIYAAAALVAGAIVLRRRDA